MQQRPFPRNHSSLRSGIPVQRSRQMPHHGRILPVFKTSCWEDAKYPPVPQRLWNSSRHAPIIGNCTGPCTQQDKRSKCTNLWHPFPSLQKCTWCEHFQRHTLPSAAALRRGKETFKHNTADLHIPELAWIFSFQGDCRSTTFCCNNTST